MISDTASTINVLVLFQLIAVYKIKTDIPLLRQVNLLKWNTLIAGLFSNSRLYTLEASDNRIIPRHSHYTLHFTLHTTTSPHYHISTHHTLHNISDHTPHTTHYTYSYTAIYLHTIHILYISKHTTPYHTSHYTLHIHTHAYSCTLLNTHTFS